MKNTYFLCAAIFSSLFLISACSNEQIESVTETQRITATVGMEESPSSKTTYTEAGGKISVGWSATKDETFFTCLVPTNPYDKKFEGVPQYSFNWKKNNGEKALFETTAEKPAIGSRWYAIYPKPDTYGSYSRLLSYTGANPKIMINLGIQSGKLEDLKYFDLLWAKCDVTQENQTSPSFTFSHCLPFVKMALNFPTAIEGSLGPCNIVISTGTSTSEATVTINLKNGKISSSTLGIISVYNVTLKGLNSKTIYLALPVKTSLYGTPADYTIDVYDTNSDGFSKTLKYSGTLLHRSNLVPGEIYRANVTMVAK